MCFIEKDKMNHECGIFGIYSPQCRDIGKTIYLGLYGLQHRGQEGCGIAITNANKIEYIKDKGLVSQVFDQQTLDSLPEGDIGLGHVRYSGKNLSHISNSQPMVFASKFGKVAFCHNGNIINTESIKKKLIQNNVLFQSDSGIEAVAALINLYSDGDIVEGIKRASEEIVGTYALGIMTTTKLIAVRDKFGVSPLVIGMLNDEYIISSETCGLDSINAKYIRDVEPGEIVVIDNEGIKSHKMESKKQALCIFEYVYFARNDSIIDGCSVYNARKRAGRMLAEHYGVDADIVSGVPDSAVVAARGYAEASGLPYIEALEKNRYVGRTFIQPNQKMRETSVNVKLNAISSNVKGKRVVLVDDSIVRGTTSKKIVDMLKRAGAKEVHMRLSSPMVKYPCFYGIDIQSQKQLIASEKNEEQIAKFIGADSVKFLGIEDLKKSCSDCNIGQCVACFSGEYPISPKQD